MSGVCSLHIKHDHIMEYMYDAGISLYIFYLAKALTNREMPYAKVSAGSICHSVKLSFILPGHPDLPG